MLHAQCVALDSSVNCSFMQKAYIFFWIPATHTHRGTLSAALHLHCSPGEDLSTAHMRTAGILLKQLGIKCKVSGARRSWVGVVRVEAAQRFIQVAELWGVLKGFREVWMQIPLIHPPTHTHTHTHTYITPAPPLAQPSLPQVCVCVCACVRTCVGTRTPLHPRPPPPLGSQ